MRSRFTVFFLLVVLAFSCQYEHEYADHMLLGSWLYVESGYSPGGGYITEPVPPVPAKTIRFLADYRISSNIEGITRYKYYRILQGTDDDPETIGFYEDYPGDTDDGSGLTSTFLVTREKMILRLHNRACIEGCHLGFRKLGDPDTH